MCDLSSAWLKVLPACWSALTGVGRLFRSPSPPDNTKTGRQGGRTPLANQDGRSFQAQDGRSFQAQDGRRLQTQQDDRRLLKQQAGQSSQTPEERTVTGEENWLEVPPACWSVLSIAGRLHAILRSPTASWPVSLLVMFHLLQLIKHFLFLYSVLAGHRLSPLSACLHRLFDYRLKLLSVLSVGFAAGRTIVKGPTLLTFTQMLCMLGLQKTYIIQEMIFLLLVLFSVFSGGFLESRGIISIKDDNAAKKVVFQLYTRDTKSPVKLDLGKGNEILKRRIKGPIKIIIHGYLENSYTPTANDIRKKFVQVEDVTTITVDWGKGSIFPIYWPVLKNVKTVGRHVGKLVDWLVGQGADLKKIHLIGHSLGAHVAGFAGASISGGRKVARITGLDPALPGFDGADPADRLDSSDADFVDVIHTCDGLYGHPGPLGHADFYVNGGRHQQPGCPVIDLGVCSHIRSVKYFTESIDPQHKFITALCPHIPRTGPSGCVGSTYLMGNYLQPSARGIFYVQTAANFPFASKLN